MTPPAAKANTAMGRLRTYYVPGRESRAGTMFHTCHPDRHPYFGPEHPIGNEGLPCRACAAEEVL